MQNGVDKIEIRKDQIKTAALRCFSQYGYNKTTMDDIANAIGMKKASLYYYYKNKETIICDTIESEVYNFLETANQKISKIKTATKKLYLLVNWETEFFQERIGTFDLSVSTIIEAQPLLHEMMEKARIKDVDLWAGIIQDGIEKGEFRKCNAKKKADTIRTVLDAINTGKEMIDLIINGLKKC